MSEIKRIGNIWVDKVKMIGDDGYVYDAWERGETWVTHSSWCSDIEGSKYFGNVASRSLPPELDKLPAMTRERADRVHAWHEANYQVAYDAIITAYPEAANGYRTDGHIYLGLIAQIIAPIDRLLPVSEIVETYIKVNEELHGA